MDRGHASPTRIRTRTTLAAALIAMMALSACGGTSAAGNDDPPSNPSTSVGEGVEVTVLNFRFDPTDTEVAVGDTVSWTNEDDILHTVTSGKGQKQGVPGVTENQDARPDGTFDGQLDGRDSGFSFTFEAAGTFSYYCAIHPGMRARVVVTDN